VQYPYRPVDRHESRQSQSLQLYSARQSAPSGPLNRFIRKIAPVLREAIASKIKIIQHIFKCITGMLKGTILGREIEISLFTFRSPRDYKAKFIRKVYIGWQLAHKFVPMSSWKRSTHKLLSRSHQHGLTRVEQKLEPQ